MKPHPIRCRCGKFEAELAQPGRTTHAVCYCRDCQAYAQFLGPPEGMLDALGGTAVVAALPYEITLRSGLEHLACMSLSPKGTLRWFARCCRTPIGNTARDIGTPYVGLVHSCLEDGGRGLDEVFGPVKMRVNKGGAKGRAPDVPATRSALAFVRLLASMAVARFGGRYRANPFFDEHGVPRVAPHVITKAERDELMRRVSGSPAARAVDEQEGA